MTDTPRGAPTDQPAAPSIPPPVRFETSHTGHFHGADIAYRCIAGETHLPDATGAPHASLFSFSYLADSDAPHARPVTFIFNGGPGSASLWLHLGALGPRRIAVPPDAAPAGSGPYAVVDNDVCNLDRSDLVFIDPPGTGFSRMIGTAKPEDAWGLDVDAALVADFIKAWLTAHRRWASPRYLCGESYGTTRAVAVAGKLSSQLSGVAFNGLALISAILDFHTARFERGNPVADVCFMPTYAMTALHFGLASAPEGQEAFLEEVRQFAANEYLPALFAGSRMPPVKAQRVVKKLARLTGLSETWLERTRMRIEPTRFRKELLRETGLSVGRLDSHYTGRDYDDAGEFPDDDAASYGMDSAFVSATSDHLGRVLGVEMDRPYVAFNRDALMKWDWTGKAQPDSFRWPGYVNVAPTLGRLLRENPQLKILIANGLFDLATPFYAVESTIAANGIDAARIRMTYYEAGHMMYLHDPSLAALVGDLRDWMK